MDKITIKGRGLLMSQKEAQRVMKLLNEMANMYEPGGGEHNRLAKASAKLSESIKNKLFPNKNRNNEEITDED